MRTLSLINAGVVFLVSTGAACGDSILLASYRVAGGFGGSLRTEERVEFLLEMKPFGFEPPGPRLGLGVFWEEGDSGSIDYTRANSPDFSEFAELATNGVADHFTPFTLWPNGAGGGAGGSEVHLFNQFFASPDDPPDLAGNTLDLVRLVVQFIDFDPFVFPTGEQGLIVTRVIKYEFYGTPIPEPGTLGLLAVGAVVVRRRAWPAFEMASNRSLATLTTG